MGWKKNSYTNYQTGELCTSTSHFSTPDIRSQNKSPMPHCPYQIRGIFPQTPSTKLYLVLTIGILSVASRLDSYTCVPQSSTPIPFVVLVRTSISGISASTATSTSFPDIIDTTAANNIGLWNYITELASQNSNCGSQSVSEPMVLTANLTNKLLVESCIVMLIYRPSL